ncbi:hypothetical protein GCK72_016318 [Caenorhabditis remanei]|uniref:Uncharacterized protein n=1 Tax=Caenorhabditis remanei TaxID=31234 RepID=A0A6A5GYQ6_CAERE|nr:hypothetical protein GCK72_016318 [Caenorhabditis remanei]KAF1759851.1 hypothetical protein GCK72_016318 [Caenorhabditis remanei]
MTILNVFPLICLVLLPAVMAQNMFEPKDDFELKKPLVVPAAEANYHFTMIEVDTLAQSKERLYGLIGVVLLDGVFTFSGIEENYLLKLPMNPKRCIPFKGINVVHKCNHEYFALNADFVNIQKTIFHKQDSLDTVCINRQEKEKLVRKFNPANDVGLKKKESTNLVVRYGQRVLMAYKPGANYNKCIGTYDSEDDYFTCMMPNKEGKLEGFEMTSFLYDEETGEPHRAENTVEVFCKLPYNYNKG